MRRKITISGSTNNNYSCTWTLVLSLVAACMGTAGLGADLSYSSPAIADINDHPNPFHLSFIGSSLGTSVIGLGACIGCPLFGHLSDMFGRRHTLILVTLPIALSYLMVTASNSPVLFIVGRTLTGFFVGVLDTIPNTYVSEISPPPLRGRLLALVGIFRAIGTIYVYGLGRVVPWTWLSVLCCLFSVIAAICFVFMAETPRWLLKQKDMEGATIALQRLRGKSYDVSHELNETLTLIKDSELDQETLGCKVVLKPRLYRPLILVSSLFILMQSVGAAAIYIHSVQIFRDTVPDFDPFIQSVLLSAFSILGSVACLAVVDRYGRKPLMYASCTMVSASMVCLGLSLKFRDQLSFLRGSDYIPSACLMFYSFAVRFGLVPVPLILLGELFPLKFRGVASGISSSVLWLFVFLCSLAFPYANLYLHNFGTYWLIAGLSFLGILFTIKFIPETKGKTLEQIELNYQ